MILRYAIKATFASSKHSDKTLHPLMSAYAALRVFPSVLGYVTLRQVKNRQFSSVGAVTISQDPVAQLAACGTSLVQTQNLTLLWSPGWEILQREELGEHGEVLGTGGTRSLRGGRSLGGSNPCSCTREQGQTPPVKRELQTKDQNQQCFCRMQSTFLLYLRPSRQ